MNTQTFTQKNTSQKTKKGFTLLFAVLVSVLVLSVGTSMINIAVKQVILSGSGRESQFAFYAANTGIECALYWDINGTKIEDGEILYVFPPPNNNRLQPADLGGINCSGGNITTGVFPKLHADLPTQEYTGEWNISDPLVTVFQIAITNDVNDSTNGVQYCAKVTVEKETIAGDVITTITSQGLNTCNPEDDPRVVQRGLVLQYES
jgi:hypothetical protein